jgi:hypothetical protein
MANPKTPGDLFFEKYCDLNGYFWTYQPALGSPGPLDYLIDRAGDRAVVEVKHFTTTRQRQKLMAAPGQAMYISSGRDSSRPCTAARTPRSCTATAPVARSIGFAPFRGRRDVRHAAVPAS